MYSPHKVRIYSNININMPSTGCEQKETKKYVCLIITYMGKKKWGWENLVSKSVS